MKTEISSVVKWTVFVIAFIVAQGALYLTGEYGNASDGGYLLVIVLVPFIFAGLVTSLYKTVN